MLLVVKFSKCIVVSKVSKENNTICSPFIICVLFHCSNTFTSARLCSRLLLKTYDIDICSSVQFTNLKYSIQITHTDAGYRNRALCRRCRVSFCFKSKFTDHNRYLTFYLMQSKHMYMVTVY